jgi:hypothetical protein
MRIPTFLRTTGAALALAVGFGLAASQPAQAHVWFGVGFGGPHFGVRIGPGYRYCGPRPFYGYRPYAYVPGAYYRPYYHPYYYWHPHPYYVAPVIGFGLNVR